MLKVTLDKLKELNACSEGFEWFRDKYPAKEVGLFDLRAHLETEDKEDWFNWLLARLLNRENKIKYAIYAAELILHIYEDKYPDDDRPRKAIEAAKNCLESGYTVDDAENTLAAARDASWSAWSAAARDASWSARAAAAEAEGAVFAVFAARDASWSAWSAARDAATTAAFAARNAGNAWNTWYAADAAATTAAFAARSAARAADTAETKKETYKKIFDYGIELLKQQGK